MSIALRITIIRGNHIRADAEIYNFDGALEDPDSQVIKLLKPDGSQQGTDYTSPTKTAVGKYNQVIEVPVAGSEGEWAVDWQVMKGSQKGQGRAKFKVIA